MSNERPYRLVSFLGNPKGGKYESTTYLNPTGGKPREVQTCFVAEALTRFLQPEEVVILATSKARKGQGRELEDRLRVKRVEWEELPGGGTERELWSQFDILKGVLRLPEGIPNRRIALDITHGFRSQPFFAAGAVTFVKLVDRTPPDISIYYGAFEARGNGETDIWDLTPLSDLVSWSSDIMLFLKTGRGKGLASATTTIGRALRKEWAVGGKKGKQPSLDDLGKALGRFAEDLETVRTGSLMLGQSSSRTLCDAIDAARGTVEAVIPPLSDVLDRIKELVSPLTTDARLSETEGLKALKSLALLYYEMGRYAEAASTIREAYINQYADPSSDCPGDEAFSCRHRKDAEQAWYEADEQKAKEIAQVRNDIGHAGYRKSPMPPPTIKKKIKELICNLKCKGNK